ncbi:MAG TPA: hypothetical protein VF807_02175 [Ktedonobacterales bacterium]
MSTSRLISPPAATDRHAALRWLVIALLAALFAAMLLALTPTSAHAAGLLAAIAV